MFLIYKLKRLRAMSLPEIFYRLFQFIRDTRDKQKMQKRPAESLELFVSKLNGEASGLEEKFKNVFAGFQNRQFGDWEKIPRHELLTIYETNFPQNRQKTLDAADQYVKHRFTILGYHLDFPDSINWHYDPLLQKSLPLMYWRDINYYAADTVKEVKYIWELNRCQHFVTLAKAFYLTKKQIYVKALFQQWSDWIDKNPYKMGINWTSSLECAFRLISWTWALAFVRKSGHLNPAGYATLLQSIHQHAQFIKKHLSKYSSANNHLIGEALGLIYAGTYYPEFTERARWQDQGFDILFKELLQQVHMDGVSKEQSTWYQKYIYDFGLLALLAAQQARADIPQAVLNRLEKMAEFCAAILDKNRAAPHIGDDDGGEALRLAEGEKNRYCSLLNTAAVLFKRADFKVLFPNFSETAFWLLGESGLSDFQQLATARDERRLIAFKVGGYIALQQQPLEQKMVFDCGPLGFGRMAAHGHADALSITLSVDGVAVLMDSGTFMYLGAGDQRDYFRGTAAHNTITIDEKNQSEMLGTFQWGRRAECTIDEIEENEIYCHVLASHNGYRRFKIKHSRSIMTRNGMWIIKDVFSGLGNHKIDAYFHCGIEDLIRNENSILAVCKKFNIEFKFARKPSSVREGLQIEKAWHSRSFGERQQHSVIRRTVTAEMPLELITKIEIHA